MLGQTSGANVSHARACWLPIDLHISRRAKWKILVRILALPKLENESYGLCGGLANFMIENRFLCHGLLVGSTRLVHGNPTLDRDGDQNHRELVPQIGIQIGIQRSSVNLGLEMSGGCFSLRTWLDLHNFWAAQQQAVGGNLAVDIPYPVLLPQHSATFCPSLCTSQYSFIQLQAPNAGFRSTPLAPSAQSKRTTIITRFSDAQQTHAECEAAACVAVTVRNTGQVAGEEVVQVPQGGWGWNGGRIHEIHEQSQWI